MAIPRRHCSTSQHASGDYTPALNVHGFRAQVTGLIACKLVWHWSKAPVKVKVIRILQTKSGKVLCTDSANAALAFASGCPENTGLTSLTLPESEARLQSASCGGFVCKLLLLLGHCSGR